MASERRNRRRSALRKKRRKVRFQRRLHYFVIFLIVALIVVGGIVLVTLLLYHARSVERAEEAAEEAALQGAVVELDEENLIGTGAEADYEEAERLAEMYDYDGAIEYLKNSEYYDEYAEISGLAAAYESEKEELVAWAPEDVTHIFFQALIVDPARAFDGDANAESYNQYNVTVDEFSRIMNAMYDEGYVMVSMHDMVDIDEDGNMTSKEIMLPAGKTPFVLSEDDVNYYHYMSDDGFAEKLVLDEDGKVKSSYVGDDGTVLVGDYDVVPWIDTFVEEHPDFSYYGHKGTIAVTGYEGVLGYRTDEVYRTKEEGRVTSFQQEFFDEHPDFDETAWLEEVEQATAVADAMKAEGWEFASHTWGHINPLNYSLESFEQDTDRWEENVEPIVGPTDIILFTYGADISDVFSAYSEDNEYFQYLKGKGFDIFCCVDSTRELVIVSDDSMRMGRREVNGYRMYYNEGMLNDLFEAEDVWDERRPDEVAQIG